MSLRARVVVSSRSFSPNSHPRPVLFHGESVAPAGDRFAPGMEFLSRLERYREVGTSPRRIFAEWQLSLAKNGGTTIRARLIRHFQSIKLSFGRIHIHMEINEVQILTPLLVLPKKHIDPLRFLYSAREVFRRQNIFIVIFILHIRSCAER